MSLVMSPTLSNASFALQSRLFMSMKRAGRVIDLVWLQQSAEYARAVLSAADNMPDAEVRDISLKLRDMLADYLAQGQSAASKVAVLPVAPRPTVAPPATTPIQPQAPEDAEHPELDRHLTSLR